MNIPPREIYHDADPSVLGLHEVKFPVGGLTVGRGQEAELIPLALGRHVPCPDSNSLSPQTVISIKIERKEINKKDCYSNLLYYTDKILRS